MGRRDQVSARHSCTRDMSRLLKLDGNLSARALFSRDLENSSQLSHERFHQCAYRNLTPLLTVCYV